MGDSVARPLPPIHHHPRNCPTQKVVTNATGAHRTRPKHPSSESTSTREAGGLLLRPEAGTAGNALACLLLDRRQKGQAGAFVVARERQDPAPSAGFVHPKGDPPAANNQKHFCGGWMPRNPAVPRNPRPIVDAASPVMNGAVARAPDAVTNTINAPPDPMACISVIVPLLQPLLEEWDGPRGKDLVSGFVEHEFCAFGDSQLLVVLACGRPLLLYVRPPGDTVGLTVLGHERPRTDEGNQIAVAEIRQEAGDELMLRARLQE